MKVDGVPRRSIWPAADGGAIEVIDQTRLPHAFEIRRLATCEDAGHAIATMVVRGAPLIGVTAAYGMAFAAAENASDAALEAAALRLKAARPTAVNLRWAVDRVLTRLRPLYERDRPSAAWQEAGRIAEEDVGFCAAIGAHGAAVIRKLAEAAGGAPLNILTHCNAGWLAAVDWGTALAPIYAAHDQGVALHVWVDETRPRNQGAALTAWELKSHGVPHTLIVDNAGGHLMQQGQVDMVIVGSDRTAANGDVCNKIGTYLKALAAHDNDIPFYAALPSSTIDWTLASGATIPIEDRSEDEVAWMSGRTADGRIERVRIAPEGVRAANPAFDVTPARLVTGIITERGVRPATRDGLRELFPDMAGG
ncbi:S-methyl-5-thioribose-1-phosphate isomerase [bacterium]|nr:S-methyl-5-thioribose-1-phosphate isomerase [bacterium]